MLAIIRVVTLSEYNFLHKHGMIITSKFGIKTKSYCIAEQPQGIYDEASELLAIPKIVAATAQAERDGAKAVFISCAADPGVQQARTACSIPVIGAGSAAAAIASALAERVGVLTLNGDVPQVMNQVLGAKLATQACPAGVQNTIDLLSPEGMEKALDAAQKLANSGVGVIVFGCTGYSTIGLAEKVEEKTGLKVVDAVVAGGLMAGYLLNNKTKEVTV